MRIACARRGYRAAFRPVVIETIEEEDRRSGQMCQICNLRPVCSTALLLCGAQSEGAFSRAGCMRISRRGLPLTIPVASSTEMGTTKGCTPLRALGSTSFCPRAIKISATSASRCLRSTLSVHHWEAAWLAANGGRAASMSRGYAQGVRESRNATARDLTRLASNPRPPPQFHEGTPNTRLRRRLLVA